MKLGIMQPYFFPYLGYFDLINRTDKWVVFDTVKYKPKGWMNRNRILDPTKEWQYISVPVDKHCGAGLISEVKVIDIKSAYKRILGQMEHYKKSRAPYFNDVIDIVGRCFTELKNDLLIDLNINSLVLVCDYLDIDFKFDVLSRMELTLPRIQHPGQWALEISDILGAKEYINPPGGVEIFKPEEFASRNIKLSFTKLNEFIYECNGYNFVGHLSILDVLMWNDPSAIKAHLESLK